MTMSWGVQVRGFDTELKCWRCLEEPVPDDDGHIGLCDHCLALLQDRSRVSRSRSSPRTTARA
jgi:hypothetical protein